VRKILLLVILLIPWPCRAQTASISPPPDLSGWREVSRSRIEVVISESLNIYMGFDIEYVNPVNPNEFIRVITKHRPSIIKGRNAPNDRLISEVVLSRYAERDRAQMTEELFKEADPVICVKWRIKKDPRTGKEIQDGDIETWFRVNSGDWLFNKNQEIRVEFLTEHIDGKLNKNILLGRKYSFAGVYNIFKPSRSDIMLAMEAK